MVGRKSWMIVIGDHYGEIKLFSYTWLVIAALLCLVSSQLPSHFSLYLYNHHQQIVKD